MSGPEGYEYRSRKTGEVAIFQHGKLVVMLRDKDAEKFLKAVDKGDPQEAMAAAAGSNKQNTKPGTGPQGTGQHLHGESSGHPHKEFRRKTG